MLVVTQFLFCT